MAEDIGGSDLIFEEDDVVLHSFSSVYGEIIEDSVRSKPSTDPGTVD